MGALSSVEAEVTRLAQAMESFSHATPPVRRMLADVVAGDTAPAPHAAAVATALARLDARLARLAEQSDDAGTVLRQVLATGADDARAEARRAAADADGRP
ncbi:hypothetical protein [Solicola sp. PLA-1-18]|uniref:hypothetical protein n=1 Tax=Solicola sp. PLA-1-18 TaxID=3380532 RepID=UPI003B782D2A